MLVKLTNTRPSPPPFKALSRPYRPTPYTIYTILSVGLQEKFPLLAVVFSPMIHCESGAGRAGKC